MSMTDTADLNNIKDCIEPHEYFEKFKNSLSEISKTEIDKELNELEIALEGAKSINQLRLIHDLRFLGKSLVYEYTLIDNGFSKYVNQSAIVDYISNVKPKNSVKIIELSRYPRMIPDESRKIIRKAQDLKIFDEFCVVFTDFTDKDYKTVEEKELVKRNRDPICFGFFINKELNEKHDRFYFITDWEDQYCDLTYDKVISKLAKDSHGELKHSRESLQQRLKKLSRDEDSSFFTKLKKLVLGVKNG